MARDYGTVALTTKTACRHCQRPTHTAEMIYHATLGWACLRCVEDTRVQHDG